jgi:hypothetical protein
MTYQQFNPATSPEHMARVQEQNDLGNQSSYNAFELNNGSGFNQ